MPNVHKFSDFQRARIKVGQPLIPLMEGIYTMITDKQYFAAAYRLHHNDGDIEVDVVTNKLPKARISRGDPCGAFVLAWVWVPNEEARKEKK